MHDGTEILTKSGLLKSMGVSLLVAIIFTTAYSYIEQIPMRTESVWATFFTSAGITFILCMAAMVVYSQFDHTPHNENHSH